MIDEGISLDGDEDISRAADLILYGKRRDQVNLGSGP